MSMLIRICPLCGSNFSAFPSQRKKYCDECLRKPRFRICYTCGKTYSRRLNQSLDDFLFKIDCSDCYKPPKTTKRLDDNGTIYKNLISQNSLCKPIPNDDEIQKDCCARFVLYLQYLNLEACNDGTNFEDRSCAVKRHLKDTMFYINKIKSLI